MGAALDQLMDYHTVHNLRPAEWEQTASGRWTVTITMPTARRKTFYGDTRDDAANVARQALQAALNELAIRKLTHR
jgi:hypothetical protein